MIISGHHQSICTGGMLSTSAWSERDFFEQRNDCLNCSSHWHDEWKLLLGQILLLHDEWKVFLVTPRRHVEWTLDHCHRPTCVWMVRRNSSPCGRTEVLPCRHDERTVDSDCPRVGWMFSHCCTSSLRWWNRFRTRQSQLGKPSWRNPVDRSELQDRLYSLPAKNDEIIEANVNRYDQERKV